MVKLYKSRNVEMQNKKQKYRKLDIYKFNKCFIVGLLKVETQKCRKVEMQKLINIEKNKCKHKEI